MRVCASDLRFGWLVGLSALWVIAGLGGETVGAGVEAVDLVRDGAPRAVLVLPAGPQADEMLAAREIAEYVLRMSGALVPTVTNPPAAPAGLPIYIGQQLFPGSEATIKAVGADAASFIVSVNPGGIRLAGLSPEGTLFAAYELLEQLGVRWFMPGDIGTVIPSNRTVRLAVQETVQVPSFGARLLQQGTFGAWGRHTRQGGVSSGAHGFPIKVDPKEHPELFCEEGGRRTGHLRVDDPEVLRLTTEATLQYFRKHPDQKYISMGPDDGAGFGSSPWDAGDMDPLSGKVSITDRLTKFFNLVLADVQKEFPDAGIGFYAYAQYMRPPVREKPNRGVLPVLAPIDVCRFHSINNPMCAERAYIRTVIDGWQALGSTVFYRGYCFNLADQGLPFSMLRQIADELPYLHEKGVIGCRVECMPMLGHHAPSLYLATRLMWNVKADPRRIMDDYFAGLYGPARAPMQAYFDLLEDTFARADFHTGNVFDMPNILTPAVMQSLGEQLAGAARAAQGADSVYAKRVAMVQLAHDYGEANLAMMRSLYGLQLDAAKAAHDRVLELLAQAVACDPPALYERSSAGYLRRFWTPTVTSGYACTQDGNAMVCSLPDEWLFLLDPLDGGEALGFYKPEMGTGSWASLKTRSRSWSSQGLRYYKGEAWYRTTAAVPAAYAGRPVHLWLGGIDDLASAWVNGQPLPLVSRGSAPFGKPWDFDATAAARAGADNVIVVKVSNRAVNELGTGGITGPAMLWSPADTNPAAILSAVAPVLESPRQKARASKAQR